jgi:hypothetical protein
MITTSTTALPTSVIIAWVRSGKAPPEWRIHYSNGAKLYNVWNFLGAGLLLCYPLVIGVALYSLATLFSAQVSPNNALIVNIGLVALFLAIFIIGIAFIGGTGWLSDRLQKRWQARISTRKVMPLMQMLQNPFFLWFIITYLMGIATGIWAITRAIVDAEWMLKGAIALFALPWLIGGRSLLARALIYGKPFLVTTGSGFIEIVLEPIRYDYPLIASMKTTEDENGIAMVYTTGGNVVWHPAHKYAITLDDIIQDYERCKARRQLIIALDVFTRFRLAAASAQGRQ